MKPLRQPPNLNPLRQFAAWFAHAKRAGGCALPEAMCLSTVDAQGRPDARMVLLKGVDERGFIFYTNLQSPKGRQLRHRPEAALTFCWEPMQRQVRIQGRTALVSRAEADAYFATRPRLSQLSAWASKQSAGLISRAVLDRRLARLITRFRGKPVPRPPHWSGIRVIPERIEFWQVRPNRLHDRFLYTRRSTRWTIQRLSP